jgi:ankyrin repeat protein
VQLCGENNLENVKQFLESSERDIGFNCILQGINMACECEFYDIAKYLILRHLNKTKYLFYRIKKYLNHEYYFTSKDILYYACKTGHLEIVRWILDYDKSLKLSDIYKGFVYACSNNIKIVMELFHYITHPENEKNMDKILDEAFDFACFNNNLKIAKYLLGYKPNINISLDNFKLICENKNQKNEELIEWLTEIIKNPPNEPLIKTAVEF